MSKQCKPFFELKTKHVTEGERELAAAINALHDKMVKTAMLSALEESVEGGSTKVITIRLSKELHGQLRNLAHDHKTSMNKLCVAKLRAECEIVLPTDED